MTYEQAHAALARRLSQQALAHSERTAATAIELAQRYGIDVDEAGLAGLLHDWDRELSDEELVERAHQLGIPVTRVDLAVPYLLHGPVAAAELATEMPGLESRVLDAIREHTYGSADMADLSKLVYVADVIEPGRTHPGVEELRARVSSASLQELFTSAYAASLRNLIERRKRIHPQTVTVWNDIVVGDRP